MFSETLLGLVAKAGSSGNSCGLMRVLLQHGAEIDAANANESTPLLQYAFASKVQGGDEEDANDEQAHILKSQCPAIFTIESHCMLTFENLYTAAILRMQPPGP